ncbi:MAG: 16S rRNA (cytosine(967)-C(5))-methyltransferase RsmB [Deltaproteobacteria bacterium]|jgi:16S rRNA (cytosine967-C5)-methyltransferase|nr:16S rRNA (cytosine(967)-C(5))-methyltransferase RsmB [Deltaproteobacteria bacterium]
MRAAAKLSEDPRLTAFNVLRRWEGGEALEEALERLGGLLTPRDAALASALVYETVRHLSRLDFILDRKLRDRRTPGGVRDVLRLGLAQLLFLDRMAEFAAVTETVELAKKVVPGRAGLVNAVLRGALRARTEGDCFPDERDGRLTPPVQRLATFYSHPLWLAERLVASLGFRQARALMAADNVSAPPTIRLNPLKTDRPTLAASLPWPTRPAVWSPWGLVPLKAAGRPESWPGFAEGLFAVQDESSQLLGLLARDRRPGRILDACAGLGGKSLALAALLPEAEIVSVDRHGARLAKLAAEARRLGLPRPPRTLQADLLALTLEGSFDLAVVDAPCSGLGVVRRRPDLKWRKTAQDPARLAELQLALLQAAAEFVAPGGRLIYSVCTYTDQEGEGVRDKFLAVRPDFAPAEESAVAPALRPLLTGAGTLRLWPHRHGTDGFFYALLEKSDS